MSDDLSLQRLDQIETELKQALAAAADHGRQALENGNHAGELLHEAEAVCRHNAVNYKDWLSERIQINREKARTLVQLHIDWPQVQERLDSQILLDFSGARRLIAGKHRPHVSVDGAMWDDDTEPPDDAYRIPETISVGFEYPDDEPEQPPPVVDAIAGIYRYVVPRRLETKEDWRTCLVRFIGTAFLLGVMPDGVSMRDACKALNVSHATISKYVRQLADATGIRSPLQKKEGARGVYSRVQKERHWRRAKETTGPSCVEAE